MTSIAHCVLVCVRLKWLTLFHLLAAACEQNSKALHRNTKDINVQNVTVLYHGAVIIDEAEVVLSYGNR